MADSYASPMRAGAPSGSPAAYASPSDIDQRLRSSDPAAVQALGRDYKTFATAYAKVASRLTTLGHDLDEAWSGKDAAAAQAVLRDIWVSAVSIHQTADEFGRAIETHGTECLAWYKQNKPPSKNLADAQSWMTGANERIYQAWSALPSNVTSTLPVTLDYGGTLPSAGTVSSGGASRKDSTPAGRSTIANHTSGSGGNLGSSRHSPGSGGSHPDVGRNTQLAGIAPTTPGTTPTAGPGLTTSGTGPSGGLPPGGGSLPGSAVSDSGGLLTPGSIGDIRQRSGVSFRDGLVSEAQTSASATAKQVRAAEANSAGLLGPSIGGGADRSDRERRSAAWLAEDQIVWTGEIEAGPQIIGGRSSTPEVGEQNRIPQQSIEIDPIGDADNLDDFFSELGINQGTGDFLEGR